MVQSLLIGLSVMINRDNIISSIKFQYAFFKGQTFKQGKLMKESEQTEKKLYQYWVLGNIMENKEWVGLLLWEENKVEGTFRIKSNWLTEI